VKPGPGHPGSIGPSVRPQKRTEESLQMVGFRVGENEYALDIMRVKEIINPVRVTSVPKAPPFIEGVIELRGAILPVVDVRRRFDLAAADATRSTKFMIVGLDVGDRRMIVALVVDGVSEPLRVAKDQIKPAPELAQGAARYFSGVVHREGRIFMVLDLDRLLSATEKETLAGMAQ
jgi:purine-binding chemotaxis protein CheW